MTNSLSKPSRIDFNKIDVHQIQRILKTGELDSLSPAERDYFSLMELVRGLRARMQMPGGGRVVTKAGIIKILKSDAYGLSDWMARQVYSDTINFFYSDEGVSPRAWANLYAEKLEKLADLSATMGKLDKAKGLIVEAAKLRGCYDQAAPEIPRELLDQAPAVIYTSDSVSMGAPAADREELKEFIDSLADIPEITRRKVKEDAGIAKKNLLNRLMEDVKEFADETE